MGSSDFGEDHGLSDPFAAVVATVHVDGLVTAERAGRLGQCDVVRTRLRWFGVVNGGKRSGLWHVGSWEHGITVDGSGVEHGGLGDDGGTELGGSGAGLLRLEMAGLLD